MTIVTAEDDPAILQIRDEMLAGEGYRTAIFEDGAASIAAAKAQQLTLVLTDLQHSVLDGAAAVRRLNRDPAMAAD
jgi:CheY-like chemotaxis protein